MLASLIVRGTDQFEGSDWERAFASAIGAAWKPSNVGLDDVVLGNCCWGAKTVKNDKPFTAKMVRLISGRNSLDFSYGISDPRAMPEADVGARVLAIYNDRVSAVRTRFKHVRTVVLLKGPDLAENAVFEVDTVRLEPELFTWSWNAHGNLVGYEHNRLRATWQPHGSQFTLHEDVPTERAKFRLCPPGEVFDVSPSRMLDSLGFEESWIEVL
ncbi:MAG: hypothetical protein AMXMBFR81_06360 [Chthonomonas sp.]